MDYLKISLLLLAFAPWTIVVYSKSVRYIEKRKRLKDFDNMVVNVADLMINIMKPFVDLGKALEELKYNQYKSYQNNIRFYSSFE